jgi:xylulokinase
LSSLILGIDLGTSGVKVGVLNLATMGLGHVAYRPYDNTPEQDPDVLFEKTFEALQESISNLRDKGKIGAIGLTGQMHGAVLYDQAGEIISPLINWQDRKYSSDLIVDKIKSIIGPAGSQDTGIDMASGLTGAILFGLKKNHPELFTRIHKFVLPTDFIRSKLLGRLDPVTDQTNAFSTGLFNTRQSKWHQKIIRKLDLPLAIFPEVRQATDVAGELHADIADRLGLGISIPVVVGGGDNQVSMLGSGLTNPDSPMLLNIGTAAQISLITSEYMRLPGVDTRSFFGGAFALVGASLAGGGSYQWLRESIQAERGLQLTYAEMDHMAAQVPSGADGLVFCPGPTRARPQREMGFLGNHVHLSSIGHRARAVMEGVLLDLYELYLGMRTYNNCEIMVGAGKGLQRSSIWSQIAADIFGKPLRITHFENALFGAALTAAVGIGALESLKAGVDSIQYDQQILPKSEKAAQYQDEVIAYWRAVLGLMLYF